MAADDAFVALVASVDPWAKLAASAEAANRSLDAPLTRNATPEPRRRSFRSQIALSVVALGGLAFLVHNELRSTDREVRDSRAGAALDTKVAVMPAMPAVPGAEPTLGAALGEPAVAAFDADAAANALASAAGRASSCRDAADPHGVAVVTITFAPSGNVSTANISQPPFMGTATGSCVVDAMRTTRIPAFTGPSVTLEQAVTIR